MNDAIDLSTAPAPAERRPPVVLQVLPSLETGAAARRAVDVAVATAEAGWTSLVVSAGGRMENELDRAGVEHIAMPVGSTSLRRIAANRMRLARLIATRNVDIVHLGSRALARSTATIARRAGSALVITVDTTYGVGGLRQRLGDRVMASGDRVVAVSDFVAGHMREVYGVADDRLLTIQGGVDLDIMSPAAVSAERQIQLATEWRLPDGVPIALVPGRLRRSKGYEVLFDALAMLGRDDVVALIVGGDADRGRYRRELEQQIAKRGLDRLVGLRGHCTDMPAAYKLADIVICPSLLPEGFSRVPIEAQAMGRPVIAADHGAMRELVVEGRTGWLVPPGNAEGLAEALNEALDFDRPLREAVAAEARSHAEAAFSHRRMCEETLRLYAELLPA